MEELLCKKKKFIRLFRIYLKEATYQELKLFEKYSDYLNEKYQEHKFIDQITDNLLKYNELLNSLVDNVLECDNLKLYDSLILFLES